ncbi:unnamed protein product [Protopolystoma xenopodis]|uniref:Uncharacterized protein n=1 Tax=Protopolystoma xenopodis TaxID=117903 RepID=A0A3S5AZD3_9PLAT|nr:unnamed protein product [Protopolystoma xenopodis]
MGTPKTALPRVYQTNSLGLASCSPIQHLLLPGLGGLQSPLTSASVISVAGSNLGAGGSGGIGLGHLDTTGLLTRRLTGQSPSSSATATGNSGTGESEEPCGPTENEIRSSFEDSAGIVNHEPGGTAIPLGRMVDSCASSNGVGGGGGFAELIDLSGLTSALSGLHLCLSVPACKAVILELLRCKSYARFDLILQHILIIL